MAGPRGTIRRIRGHVIEINRRLDKILAIAKETRPPASHDDDVRGAMTLDQIVCARANEVSQILDRIEREIYDGLSLAQHTEDAP